MLEKVIYIFRNIYIRIISRGRVTIPFHSRISDRTEFYTNNGTIKAGVGFVTSSNSVFSALDGGTMTIGERVFVNRNCIFVCRKDIRIGNHCSFGPNVCIYDHDHKYGYHGPVQGYKYGKVIIEDHCWIGSAVSRQRCLEPWLHCWISATGPATQRGEDCKGECYGRRAARLRRTC